MGGHNLILEGLWLCSPPIWNNTCAGVVDSSLSKLFHCSALVLTYAPSSFPYLGLLWSPLLLFSLASMLQSSSSPSSRSRHNLSLTLSRLIGVELHSEESSVAFSRSIGMELDSEGSIMSTWTGTGILKSFSTCANLKCTHAIQRFRYIATCEQASIHMRLPIQSR